MRTLDEGFAAHIASGQTTLTNCWRVIRTDSQVLGFTDHDVALNFDGTTFAPAHGLDGGETAAKLGQQIDTSEVLGIVHADAVSEDDILLGRYDGAIVETWRVNWRDVSQRHLMRRDTVGEITRVDGVFRLELRSAQHALNVPKGKIYQALCGTHLGASRCGIDLENPAYTSQAVISSLTDRHTATTGLLAGFADGWFDYGYAVWTSGKRLGKRDRITSQVTANAVTKLTFAEAIEDWIVPTDTLTLYAGCDRRFETCRTKFDNIVNFRGHPHIPGSDFVLRYPRAGGSFNGQPIVR